MTARPASGRDVNHQRSATLHGAYLALAHLASAELEEAAEATVTAGQRLTVVASGRCHALLRQLRKAFERHRRNDSANTAISALSSRFIPALPLIWNQQHQLHILRKFEQFYNSHRPHQGIANPDKIAHLDIRRRDRLGGILHEYEHAA
ncbi:hypothetical protein [Saccharopolyspora spinosa]|uniref:Integrase-like protein n=1 Tax=Saccharopolyspora spinosa TaxID=60894 RepID=A0A2N3Y6G4_SACSN|nr:hypothetical protein [Saccharopolyspora spinosa]PKW18519.1 hypothetical protein A8926_6613 [Saccharopolyspora spinosa]